MQLGDRPDDFVWRNAETVRVAADSRVGLRRPFEPLGIVQDHTAVGIGLTTIAMPVADPGKLNNRLIAYKVSKCVKDAPKKKRKKKVNGKEVEVEECNDPCDCIDDDKVSNYQWRGAADYAWPPYGPSRSSDPKANSRNSNSFVGFFMRKCGFSDQDKVAMDHWTVGAPGFLVGWTDGGRP